MKTTIKIDATQNRYDVAAELGLPNELIENVQYSDGIMRFAIKGMRYDARLTATGKIKKNSVRRDFL